VGAGLILSACQTTENKYTAETATVLKSARSIGYYLGYSRVCAQFKGIRVDSLIARDLKEKYSRSEGFQRGYERNAHALGAGSVTGFDRCEFAVRSLELTHAKYSETAQIEKSPVRLKNRLPIGDYNLEVTLDADGRVFKRDISVSNTLWTKRIKGSTHITNYIEIMPEQFCRLKFVFQAPVLGNWNMSCEDGQGAKGTFDVRERNHLIVAVGEKGVIRSFSMLPKSL